MDSCIGNNLRLTLTGLISPFLLTFLFPYTPLSTPPAYAQADTAEADRLNQQVGTLYKQGKYAEAILLAEKVLAIREKVLGPEHPDVADILNNLAVLYQTQGQYGKAELFYQRSLAIREKALGPEHPNVATRLNNLAELYREQGQYAKAEPLYQRSLAIREKALSPDHPDVATSLNNLALLYDDQGQYAKAEPLLQRSLAIWEKAFGPDHPNVATSLNNLAGLYQAQGQYGKAEPLYQRSLAIREKALSPDHSDVATSLNNLAGLYQAQGQYGKAEPFYRRSLAIREKALGSDHPNVALSLNNLALLYDTQGQYSKAEPLYQRSLAIREKALGSNHPDVADSLNNLAELYRNQGQYSKAEPLYQRSLAIREKALGPDHPNVATSLNNLAGLYDSQGQYVKAEPLYQRSLAILEKALGPDHPNVATSLNNLAELYRVQSQYDKSEMLYQRSLAIREKVLGPDHPDVAQSLNNLANLYDDQGQYGKAEPFYQRSLAIWEEALGSDHPDVATSLNNLASLYDDQGQYGKAELFYQRSLAVWEKALGPNHPNVATSLNNLAVLYQTQNDLQQAVQLTARALDIEETNLSQNLVIGSEQDKRDYLATFSGSTDSAISLHLQAAPNNPDAAKLAFTTILRRKGRVLDVLGQNLQQLRQRLDPGVQSTFDQLIAVRAQLAKLVTQPNLTPTERQTQYQTLSQQTQTLEANLSRQSIAFQQATQSVSLAAVQAAIPQDAALIEFIQYKPFNPKAKPAQRFGLPHYAVYLLRSDGQPQWADLGTAADLDPLIESFRKIVPDRRKTIDQVKAVARQLDAKLMQPVRALLKSQPQHLLISPDSQLNLIPFAALVDEQNRYLIETYQITYLTSGRDLVRKIDPTVKVQAPLILANPNYTLAEVPHNKTLIARDRGSSERSTDLTTLSFDPLEGTAVEAKAITPLLPQARLFTQTQATETVVKQSDNPRILHFATHGFFLKNKPQQPEFLPGKPQPFTVENPLLRSGLALAGISKRESGTDDGVLTALEVAGLDLRATELVVLSACDTGKGEVATGEGVYGLRRAFTLAGAHSQVMSLWKVNDLGAKDFMIRYYQALQQDQGRGEALRQVQLDMLNQKLKGQDDTPYQHPYYWSAFIPLGDWSPLPKN